MEFEFLFLATRCYLGDKCALFLAAREEQRSRSIEANGETGALVDLQRLGQLTARRPKAQKTIERAGGESCPFCVPGYRRDAGFSGAAVVVLF